MVSPTRRGNGSKEGTNGTLDGPIMAILAKRALPDCGDLAILYEDGSYVYTPCTPWLRGVWKALIMGCGEGPNTPYIRMKGVGTYLEMLSI